MTDKKITQLTALTGANAVAGDQLAIVDVSDTTMSASGTTKKIALSELQAAPLSAGTANGVAYLNGSKVLTTGSALTFDGTNLNLALGSAFFTASSNQTSFNRSVNAEYPTAESTAVTNTFRIGNRLNATFPDRGASIRFVQSGTTNIFGEAATVVQIWTWNTGFDSGNPRLTIAANGNTHPSADDVYDIGTASFRWNDVFATNALIQTSDANEKQDIEELSETERRVAVTAKSLLRKFRWKSAVETKGSDARIHFGIIAQELQAAFEAEGLDAGRYGMFTDTAWWESYVNVPAVEAKDAVFNENGDLIEEAVRAQDAHVRTDTYHSEKEAPAGAVKKSRMGIRYSELLAFMIAAL